GWGRKLRPFPLLLLLIGILLSFRSGRDVWFVVLVATPIIADAYTTEPSADRFSITRIQIVSCTGVLLLALIVIGWYRHLSQSDLESAVVEHYPVLAVTAVREHNYPGPLYNDYDWGGFLVWSLRTPPVSLDNRGALYGFERVEQSMKIWA